MKQTVSHFKLYILDYYWCRISDSYSLLFFSIQLLVTGVCGCVAKRVVQVHLQWLSVKKYDICSQKCKVASLKGKMTNQFSLQNSLQEKTFMNSTKIIYLGDIYMVEIISILLHWNMLRGKAILILTPEGQHFTNFSICSQQFPVGTKERLNKCLLTNK